MKIFSFIVPLVLESAEIWKESWNVLESPGILLKFQKSPKKALNFFLVKQSKREISKHKHFSGFLCMLNLAFYWLTALIFIWGVLDAIMSIYSHHITRWQYSKLQLGA